MDAQQRTGDEPDTARSATPEDGVCTSCGSGQAPLLPDDWRRQRYCPRCFREYEAVELAPVTASIPTRYLDIFAAEALTTLAMLADGLSGHLHQADTGAAPFPPEVEQAWIDGRLARMIEVHRIVKEANAAGTLSDFTVTASREVLTLVLNGAFETLRSHAATEIGDAASAADLATVNSDRLDPAAFFASARDRARAAGGDA